MRSIKANNPEESAEIRITDSIWKPINTIFHPVFRVLWVLYSLCIPSNIIFFLIEVCAALLNVIVSVLSLLNDIITLFNVIIPEMQPLQKMDGLLWCFTVPQHEHCPEQDGIVLSAVLQLWGNSEMQR